MVQWPWKVDRGQILPPFTDEKTELLSGLLCKTTSEAEQDHDFSHPTSGQYYAQPITNLDHDKPS